MIASQLAETEKPHSSASSLLKDAVEVFASLTLKTIREEGSGSLDVSSPLLTLQGREGGQKNWVNNQLRFHDEASIKIPELSCRRGFSGGSDGKESTCKAGDLGLIPGWGRSPGEGNGNPLQCSCLENPMDRGDWWVTVHGGTKSQTQLSDSYTHTHTHTHTHTSTLCRRASYNLVLHTPQIHGDRSSCTWGPSESRPVYLFI